MNLWKQNWGKDELLNNMLKTKQGIFVFLKSGCGDASSVTFFHLKFFASLIFLFDYS